MTAADWQVVLTADGAVLAVTGGAPLDWVGRRFEDCDGVADTVRRAARTLLDTLHGSVAPMAMGVVRGPSDNTIQLIALEAIPLRRAPVDLRALLSSVIAVMRAQASAMDVDLAFAANAELPSALSLDPDKVAWAIATLLGNALRYVRRGSRLMPGGLVSIEVAYDSVIAEVSIAVRDNGVGISPATLSDLYRRAPDRPFAAGLGLRMVRDVVAAHGGRVDVSTSTDAADHGTTVRLTFPVV